MAAPPGTYFEVKGQYCDLNAGYLIKCDCGAVKDLLPQINYEDVADDKVYGAVGGIGDDAGPSAVRLDVSPLAVGRVHYGVGEVEGLADGLQEVDLIAPVVPVFISGSTTFLLWYLWWQLGCVIICQIGIQIRTGGLPFMTYANFLDFFYPLPCRCHKSADVVPFVCFFWYPLPHPLRTSYMEAPKAFL